MPTGMARWGFFTSSPAEETQAEVWERRGAPCCGCVLRYSPLTCGGDAVKPYEGIKTGGSARKDPRPAEGQEATRTKEFLWGCRTGQTGDDKEDGGSRGAQTLSASLLFFTHFRLELLVIFKISSGFKLQFFRFPLTKPEMMTNMSTTMLMLVKTLFTQADSFTPNVSRPAKFRQRKYIPIILMVKNNAGV